MQRVAKTPREIRQEAARLCRKFANECITRGATESADALRESAEDIMRIRLTRDV